MAARLALSIMMQATAYELTLTIPLARPLSELDDRARLDVLVHIADKYLHLSRRIVEGGVELKVANSRFEFARINLNHKPVAIL